MANEQVESASRTSPNAKRKEKERGNANDLNGGRERRTVKIECQSRILWTTSCSSLGGGRPRAGSCRGEVVVVDAPKGHGVGGETYERISI